jgi:hypothetical protein
VSKHYDEVRRWRMKHPEEYRRANHEHYMKHRKQYVAYHRKVRLAKYGLTAADFEALLVQQGGACAICRKKFVSIPRVDHNHATGKVRGLLCHSCNTGLGMFQDSRLLVQLADEYLAARDGVR